MNMEATYTIETERLQLRQWQQEDIASVVAINQDPRVTEFLGQPLSAADSVKQIDKFCSHFAQYGYGPWSCVLKSSKRCIGFVGLYQTEFPAAFTPCTEILWRLDSQYWGEGYATEAAQASVVTAFKRVSLPEIVSFTAYQNHRSRRVMEKLGMQRFPDYDFHHPKFPFSHPLSFHVLYRITREQYLQTFNQYPPVIFEDNE